MDITTGWSIQKLRLYPQIKRGRDKEALVCVEMQQSLQRDLDIKNERTTSKLTQEVTQNKKQEDTTD